MTIGLVGNRSWRLIERVAQMAIALALILSLAVPMTAQNASRPAKRGELVFVKLRDGRQLVGDVGAVDESGFYIKPPEGAEHRVQKQDIETIRDASHGKPLDFPTRGGGNRKAVILTAAVAAGLAILAAYAHGLGKS